MVNKTWRAGNEYLQHAFRLATLDRLQFCVHVVFTLAAVTSSTTVGGICWLRNSGRTHTFSTPEMAQ
jgi:hypothetical protein